MPAGFINSAYAVFYKIANIKEQKYKLCSFLLAQPSGQALPNIWGQPCPAFGVSLAQTSGSALPSLWGQPCPAP